jgi:spore maturation protein CgeB
MSELPRRRILYVGPDIAGSTTLQRLHALRELSHNIAFVSTAKRDPSNAARLSLFTRVQRKVFGPQDKTAANSRILAAIQKTQFDIIWIDKGLTIQPGTLKSIREIQPNSRIVGFSPDDMMNPANQSKAFLLGLPKYHFFVTTKSYNVAELKALGCHQVIFIDNSYDPATHRPVAMSDEDMTKFGGRVGFIVQL